MRRGGLAGGGGWTMGGAGGAGCMAGVGGVGLVGRGVWRTPNCACAAVVKRIVPASAAVQSVAAQVEVFGMCRILLGELSGAG